MDNFAFYVPTKVYFGKGQIVELGGEAKKYGNSVLLVYGGGSIKKNGIYDEAQKTLKENGLKVYELSGVEPNPRVESVEKGVELCRTNKIDMVLAIGCGSSIDCAKVIASCVYNDNSAWEIVKNPSKITKVMPILAVLTLSATGSEMDAVAVISNMATNDKMGLGHVDMRPKVSILDPTYTYSVNAYHSAAGTADIMSHIFECYFSNKAGYMQDRMAEGLLKTCIKFGKRVIEEPTNYEARANLMWVGSWAINDFIKLGKPVTWSAHPMEHQLSAFYDITHGIGLAIITPHWMSHILNNQTVEKFKVYGINVWGIDASKDSYTIANEAIAMTSAYFKSMGIPMSLSEVGITNKDKFDIMAEKASRGLATAYVALSKQDVYQIFEKAL